MRYKPIWKKNNTRGYRKRSGRSGFTLVELSIVILVLSMLFTILFGFFFNISEMARQQHGSIDSHRRAILAMEIVRENIERTFYIPDVIRVVFAGRKNEEHSHRLDRLTFASVHPGAEATGSAAVREVSFYVKKSDNEKEGGILIKREDTMVDDHPGNGGVHLPLLDHVSEFSLRYSADGVTWVDEWNSKKKKGVPRLVQIRISVTRNDKNEIYESLVSPGIFEEKQKSGW